MTWMAGIRPIRMAEFVRLLTNKGKTVENDANPSAMPKKAPSNTLTTKLNGKCLLCSIPAVLKDATIG